MFLEFTTELDPKNFKNVCPCSGNARDLQLTVLYWGLACTYQSALLNSIQHPQEEENASGFDPAPVADAAA